MNETENEIDFCPVSIRCGFATLEQKIIFEAVVLPEITCVLHKYAPLLGYSNGADSRNEKKERK